MKFKMYKSFAGLAIVSLLCTTQTSFAQHLKRKVLFIGNSFTGTNMLPLLIKDAALSAGDTLETDWNTPGAFTFEQHIKDIITTGKISLGSWNYVVLQEQSQRPAFSDAEVAMDVFPYAHQLDSLVHNKNKCGRSVFFQTWGYRDGDAANCPTFPPICTYEGMDSLLEKRYRQMAIDNNALLSPVGLVFNKIKAGMPAIDLYDGDGMHPSQAGSFAAAITFYTILFGKNPNLVTFNHSVPPPQADFIRNIVRVYVYDALPKFFVGNYNPDAVFTSSVVGNTVTFNSAGSKYISNYNWDFGDGGTSTLANPVYSYAAAGTYNVRLIGDDCMIKDTAKSTVTTTGTSITEFSVINSISIYPNPASNTLNIQSAMDLKNLSVSISNVLGAKVLHDVDFNAKPIHIETLPSGVYLLHLQDKSTGESTTRKFVKN